MRDAINPDEFQRLVRGMKSGLEWGEVRGILPGVDPEALDRAFKGMVLKAAGIEAPPQAQYAPENHARVVERTMTTPSRKKG